MGCISNRAVSRRYRGDIALNRAEIAERFTRVIFKLQLQGDKNCIELLAATKIACVNWPLHSK